MLQRRAVLATLWIAHAFLTWSVTAIVFTICVLQCPKGWIYNRAALLTPYNRRDHDHGAFCRFQGAWPERWRQWNGEMWSHRREFGGSTVSIETHTNARKESGLLHHFYGCRWIYSHKWTCGPELLKNNEIDSASTVAIASTVKIVAATINGQP